MCQIYAIIVPKLGGVLTRHADANALISQVLINVQKAKATLSFFVSRNDGLGLRKNILV